MSWAWVSKVLILVYHAIGDGVSPVLTPLSEFEAHLDALARGGWQPVTLSAVLDWLVGSAELPERSVALTFDDGYESVFKLARPLLEERGIGAAVFVISGYTGRNNRWPGQPAFIPEMPLMDWGQITGLIDSGFEIGAHTVSHPPLALLSNEAVEKELKESKRRIQVETGKAPEIFAPPYGSVNEIVNAVAREHFRGAVGTRQGWVTHRSHAFNLPRLDAHYLCAGALARLASGSLPRYLPLINVLRAGRRLFRKDWEAF